MMKQWHFNVLFAVGVGGALVLLLGESLGLKVTSNPTAVTGIGAILTYVLTQRSSIVKKSEDKSDDSPKSERGEGDGPK